MGWSKGTAIQSFQESCRESRKIRIVWIHIFNSLILVAQLQMNRPFAKMRILGRKLAEKRKWGKMQI
jgi:hypothetical protein